tara:strand:- start:92 stop:823 length:732 start_codon:yes stop_codon:yes gene_type:complete
MSTTNNIIERLKIDQEYYRGVGKNYISNSDIGTLLKNPKMFGVERSDDLNLAKGRLFHQLLLEPNKAQDFPVIDVSSRNTKAYKEFVKECGTFALLSKEVNEVYSYVEEVERNIRFLKLINNCEKEVPKVGELFGAPFKGRADMVTDDCIYDLKTTRNIHEFRWSAKRYNYDSQAYIYQELFGKPMVFLVVCKETLQTGIFTCSNLFIESGRDKVERAVDVYERFFGQNPDEDINTYYITEEL